MSSVRMCDRCGNIFSEREEGWSTGTINQTRRDEKGVMRTYTDSQDACPICASGTGVPTPRLSIESASGVDRIANIQTQADRDRILTEE